MDQVIVNVCPTGMIPTKQTSPSVPISPKEIALDAKRCHEAGASIIHIHARALDGEPTWERPIFEDIIGQIISYIPDMIICVTTSGRNWSDLQRRTEVLRLEGACKPEMASLTLGSMNFAKTASVNSPETINGLIAAMSDAGIVPECEIFDIGMANRLATLHDRGELRTPLYCNILLGSQGTADLSALNLAAIQTALPPGTTWALAGIGRFQLPANTMALALGGHVRVGLEDNPYMNWSTREHATNPRLVERIVSIGRLLGREPASPAEARRIIGIDMPRRLAA